MIPSFRQTNFLKIDNVVPLFISVALIFSAISAGIIYYSSITQKTSELRHITERMNDNIRYSNGVWDLSLLNSDPILPGSNPHYILTTDGYVIERWRPIHGYLDTSDYRNILNFENPETILTPAQESWRVLSQAVKSNGTTIGAVYVARFIAEGDNLEFIDRRMRDDLAFVMKKIAVKGDQIDTSALDLRETRYDISVKIVDQYNEVITKTNNSNSIDRAPNYIDTSYIAKELDTIGTRTVHEEGTGNPYLIMSSPFVENGKTVGLLVTATSLQDLYSLAKAYAVVMLILSIATTIILKIGVENYKMNRRPSSIRFSQEDAVMRINDQRITFPDDSHQYQILYRLFKDPEKSYSTEEIIEALGDDEAQVWRRVYDAMLVVNKKVEPFLGAKLIVIKDKKFLLNPELLDVILS